MGRMLEIRHWMVSFRAVSSSRPTRSWVVVWRVSTVLARGSSRHPVLCPSSHPPHLCLFRSSSTAAWTACSWTTCWST